ncbi:MAG: HAMP domain-containing sensor histidine kinase, partial [Planctomycetota bacterium]
AAVAVGAGTLSLVLGAGYRSFVAQPLRRVLDAMRRLRNGECGVRVHLAEGDEMGSLARAVNEVARQEEQRRAVLEERFQETHDDLHAVLTEAAERSDLADEVRAQLTEADRQRMRFLTHLSHELRTPLTSIRGFLKLVEEELYDSEEERKEFLENTRDAAGHMLHVLDNMLAAARLAHDSVHPHCEPVDAADVARESVRILDPARRDKGLEIRVESEGDGVVEADRGLLRQVLLNLIGNAIKFTEEGGIVVGVRTTATGVRFEVRDTGVGIAPAQRERIFRPFYQPDSATSRAKGGIGLGLALSRELVEEMGGRLGVHSDGEGQGACFHFTLPAALATLPA